jgi:hypothetical protein
MEVYLDHVTQNKKLIIVASLPGGATEGDFNLLGAGPGSNIARITYKWPEACYNIDRLFRKSIASGALPDCHPKIVALKRGLQRNRASMSKAPVGVISLNLPISVLTSESSIDVKGGLDKENGTYLLIIELTAFETAYAVEKKPIKNEEI